MAALLFRAALNAASASGEVSCRATEAADMLALDSALEVPLVTPPKAVQMRVPRSCGPNWAAVMRICSAASRWVQEAPGTEAGG